MNVPCIGEQMGLSSGSGDANLQRGFFVFESTVARPICSGGCDGSLVRILECCDMFVEYVEIDPRSRTDHRLR